MKLKSNYPVCLLTVTVLFLNISCELLNRGKTGLSESLDPVEAVSLVPGGENVTIIVNNSQRTYFGIEFSGIKSNDLIENGIWEGWCIDWHKTINSNGGAYNSVKLYSTYLVEKWKPVNYRLNIEEELRGSDPNLTLRDVQVAIWSLRANPVFDLDKIAVEDLPGDMRNNGEPNFSYQKVRIYWVWVDPDSKSMTLVPAQNSL